MELHRYCWQIRETNFTLNIAALRHQQLQQHYLLDIEHNYHSKAINCLMPHKPAYQYESFQISTIYPPGQTK
jgi:hypothetical protein